MLFSRHQNSALARIGPRQVFSAQYARGAFKAQARWISARLTTSIAHSSDGPGGLAAEAGDDELARLLAAIADEVGAWAAGARASVSAEYAGRISHAQKYLPKHEVAGAVRALKEACQAALAAISRTAQAELMARREAAIRLRHRPQPAARPSPRPKPPKGPTRT
jgi:hypothetical protein